MAEYKDFKSLGVALVKAVSKQVETTAMKEVGDLAIKNLVTRVKLGYGVLDDYGPRQKLAPLSKKYVRMRKASMQGMVDFDAVVFDPVKLAKIERVQFKAATVKPIDQSTTPAKSNLTFTNQLLKSIKPTNATTSQVTIEPTGSRDGSDLSNADVAALVSKKRPFFFITDLEFTKIVNFIRDKITQGLDKT